MNHLAVAMAVKSGYRLPKPLLCPENVFTVILSCWKERRLRPRFADLLAQLNTLREDAIEHSLYAAARVSTNILTTLRQSQSGLADRVDARPAGEPHYAGLGRYWSDQQGGRTYLSLGSSSFRGSTSPAQDSNFTFVLANGVAKKDVVVSIV